MHRWMPQRDLLLLALRSMAKHQQWQFWITSCMCSMGWDAPAADTHVCNARRTLHTCREQTGSMASTDDPFCMYVAPSMPMLVLDEHSHWTSPDVKWLWVAANCFSDLQVFHWLQPHLARGVACGGCCRPAERCGPCRCCWGHWCHPWWWQWGRLVRHTQGTPGSA
jgi:hypothetical protein